MFSVPTNPVFTAASAALFFCGAAKAGAELTLIATITYRLAKERLIDSNRENFAALDRALITALSATTNYGLAQLIGMAPPSPFALVNIVTPTALTAMTIGAVAAPLLLGTVSLIVYYYPCGHGLRDPLCF